MTLQVQAPEDEMRRIEDESKRFPWVNQGQLSLLIAQLKQGDQGAGGGNPGDTPADMAGNADASMQAGDMSTSADSSSMMLPDSSGPHGGYA